MTKVFQMVIYGGAEKSVPYTLKRNIIIVRESIATEMRRYCVSCNIDIQFPSVYNGKVKFCACG